MITSTQNTKIKWLRALQTQSKQRRTEGLFIVEGVRLAEEALQTGWPARLVLASEALNERGRAIVDGFAGRGVPSEVASEHVMQAASDTQTPQGLLVVLEMRAVAPPAGPSFALAVDGIRDPGNLGAILRSSAAAGVELVYLLPGVVDPYAPKVVRAAMGAHFRLPLASVGWEAIAAQASQSGLRVFLADASGELEYTRADLRAPLLLVLGGEASGASLAAGRLAHARLRIPMPGQMESLNAAAAAAVLLFEVLRQRCSQVDPSGLS
jgi:TrmH family RNA methyltransferase